MADSSAALLTRIERFAERSGYTPATVCQYIFKDGDVYDRLKNGGTVGMKNFDKAREWFKRNARKTNQRKRAAT